MHMCNELWRHERIFQVLPWEPQQFLEGQRALESPSFSQ